MKNERGFTLLEGVFTLLILTVVTFFSFQLLHSLHKETTETLFIRQLQRELLVIQMQAKAEKKNVALSFFSTYYEKRDGETIIRHHYPETIRYMETSNIQTIMINPKGHVRKFGTLYFKSGSKIYRLRLQIGKGRLLYEE